MEYQGLNEEQTKAMQEVIGPVCVFAGAGSGKTRTLTMRIRHMIEDCFVSPFNILAITYTNKATKEMKDRLKERSFGVTISTFHSLCTTILRKEIEVLGYQRDFAICDEDDQSKIINEVIKDAGEQKGIAKDLQKAIKRSKSFMSKPDSPYLEELFDRYNQKLKELNMLDFDDLLLKVHELFKEYPDVLNKYQEKYQFILVDEFQDTNLVQYKIVKALASKYRNLFIVGDDDQSIYSFRGTNYENFNLFKEDFSDYKLFTLTTNYRSSQHILDYCNRLIAENDNRQPKEMKTTFNGESDDVVLHTSNTEEDEAFFVANKIQEMANGANYDRFAVLYRNSVLSRNVETELIRRNLPYKVYGGLSYLKRREVKDIAAYFRLMMNPNDLISFKRIINVPSRGIGLVTIDKLEKIKKTNKINCLETIDLASTVVPKSKVGALEDFKNIILRYKDRLETDDLVDLFTELIDEIGFYKYLEDEYGTEEAKERRNNVDEFASILYKVDNYDLDTPRLVKLANVFDEMTLSENKRNGKERDDGITLSTIHSVKGLEFDTVFIIGLEEDIFPGMYKSENDMELEEERRICYVAMTRAKKKLFLCHSITRVLYGRKFNNRPSRFLLEAVGKSKVTFSRTTEVNEDKSPEVKEKRTITVEAGYQVSDKVIHSSFGEGIIISIDRQIGTIFFPEIKATKKILLTHPTLSKKE